jgi:serine/threonine-protein kinase HipA
MVFLIEAERRLGYKFSTTEFWANCSKIPWHAIKPHLADTMEKARSLWPDEIKSLPMNGDHKKKLEDHWSKLQENFQIK